MTEAEFLKLANAGYTRIPVLAKASADLYTPLAVYMMLADGPYSYLIDPEALLTEHGHKMLQNFTDRHKPVKAGGRP